MRSADQCRENGWGAGTLLVGDEGHGPTVILITAVGERNVLARAISENGKPVERMEASWTLSCREWARFDGGRPARDGRRR